MNKVLLLDHAQKSELCYVKDLTRPLLLRTLFIRHAATSCNSSAHRVETQQNIELMTFALTFCANIFVGCSLTPTFFRQITSFSDSFRDTKKQKKSVRGKF